MRFGPEDITPPAEHAIASAGRLPARRQLQINQLGAWRGVVDYDAAEVPPEFLQAAEQLARLAGENTRMRVVYCQRSDNGSYRPSQKVLMHWSRLEGWVNT